jgi:hypothetical protein
MARRRPAASEEGFEARFPVLFALAAGSFGTLFLVFVSGGLLFFPLWIVSMGAFSFCVIHWVSGSLRRNRERRAQDAADEEERERRALAARAARAQRDASEGRTVRRRRRRS